MAPWALAKQPGKEAEVQAACTVALNLFRQIVLYLAPVLPEARGGVGRAARLRDGRWELSQKPLVGTPVAPYQHLMKRMEMDAVQKMIAASRAGDGSRGRPRPRRRKNPPWPTEAPAKFEDSGDALAKEPLAPQCTIDDFTKVDLRVARIVAAEGVAGAKKLLKLTVSLGGDATRTVFAGIKAYYDPKDLVGRLVIVCANLAPRQMKFGLSEGMVLAAGDGDRAFLLSPDSDAKPGMRVH